MTARFADLEPRPTKAPNRCSGLGSNLTGSNQASPGQACVPAGVDPASACRKVLALQRAIGNGETTRFILQRPRAAIQRAPLSESEKAVDLESGQLSDDGRLQQAFDNSPPVQLGASGPHVAKIQQGLLDCGFAMPRTTGGGTKPPDGIFGEETLNVLKGFQLHQGIDRDGIAGRQTLGELDGRLTGTKPPGSGFSGPAPPAIEVTVSPVDVVPLTLLDCGEFLRKFDWQTNARNGYLIQEVRSSRSRQDCQGTDLGDDTVANRYWEAWRVQEDGEGSTSAIRRGT